MMKVSRLRIERALALEGVFDGKYRSKVTMIDGIYYSEMPPVDLLNEICMHFGATKKGRVDAAKSLLGFSKKTPFIIVPGKVAAVPLVSPDRDDCVWIFNHPFKTTEISKGKSLLTYRNGAKVEVPCSKYTLLKQENRIHTLLSKLEWMKRWYIIY